MPRTSTVPIHLTKQIMVVKIHKALDEGKTPYEAIRGNWQIDKKRLPFIKYVVGMKVRAVECAYTFESWSVVESGNDMGKMRFEGEEAPDIRFRAVNAAERLYNMFGKGGCARVYAFLSELD